MELTNVIIPDGFGHPGRGTKAELEAFLKEVPMTIKGSNLQLQARVGLGCFVYFDVMKGSISAVLVDKRVKINESTYGVSLDYDGRKMMLPYNHEKISLIPNGN